MLKKLLIEESDKIYIQLIRYAFVGGLSFIADIGALYLLTEFAGLHYLLSAASGFIVGLIVNYSLSVKWVFNVDITERKLSQFLIFGIIGIVGLGLNELIIWFITEKLQVYYLYSKIISTVIVLFWNFLARRKLMLKK
ncbi:GtrA family protein [Candidatus Cloacimonadota bacterium]